MLPTTPQRDHGIHPNLAALATPLHLLTRHPRDPYQPDTAAAAMFLARHGQYRPVIYQAGTGHVLKGADTLAAARSLGWTHVAALALTVTDPQALAVLLVDRATAAAGTYDDHDLHHLLGQLDLTDAAIAGYTPDDLDALLARLDRAAASAPSASPTPDAPPAEPSASLPGSPTGPSGPADAPAAPATPSSHQEPLPPAPRDPDDDLVRVELTYSPADLAAVNADLDAMHRKLERHAPTGALVLRALTAAAHPYRKGHRA